MTTKARVQPSQLEEVIVYLMLLGIGAIPVVITTVHGDTFGWEPTVGLIMMLLGVAGLLAALWRSRTGR